MKYTVFFDTNIYDEADNNFSSMLFTRLKEYADEGRISLQINSVIEGEVREHIQRDIGNAVKTLNRAVSEYSLSGLSNHPEVSRFLRRQDPSEMIELIWQDFQDFLSSCKAERLSVNGIDLEDVMVSCFRKEAPFDSGRQDAFKDAIAAASLAQAVHSMKNGKYCVVSADDSFLDAVRSSLRMKEDEDVDDQGKVMLFDSLFDFIEIMEDDDAPDIDEDEELSELITRKLDKTIRRMDINFKDIERFIVNKEIVELDGVDFFAHVIKYDKKQRKAIAVLEVMAELTMDYSYIDEDESCYDEDIHDYIYQNVTEMFESFEIEFNAVVEITFPSSEPGHTGSVRIIEAPAYIDLDEDCIIDDEGEGDFLEIEIDDDEDEDDDDEEEYDEDDGDSDDKN